MSWDVLRPSGRKRMTRTARPDRVLAGLLAATAIGGGAGQHGAADDHGREHGA